jgi:hypothetical protein
MQFHLQLSFPQLTPFATDLQPPTHGSLRVLQRELNSNAMSVHSNYGGGRYGHLTLAWTILPILHFPILWPTQRQLPLLQRQSSLLIQQVLKSMKLSGTPSGGSQDLQSIF